MTRSGRQRGGNRWRRRLPALGLLAALAVFGALPAAAAPKTITLQINMTLPIVNYAALGTATVNFDEVTGKGTWSFQGTIGGELAKASGTGSIRNADSSLIVTMESIDTWQMPRLRRPVLPASATIWMVGNTAYVSYDRISGAPVAASPPLSFPLYSGTYTLTTAGSGQTAVTGLLSADSPVEEEPGQRGNLLLYAATALGLAAAAGAILLTLRRRRPHPAAEGAPVPAAGPAGTGTTVIEGHGGRIKWTEGDDD